MLNWIVRNRTVWSFNCVCTKYFHKSYISSSSCHAISMDIPNPFSPPFSIVYCFRRVFNATFCIDTELLYVGSCWFSGIFSSMWRGQQEYVTYESVPTSPAVFRMSASSKFDSFLRWVVSGRTAAALWYTVSRTNSILLAPFLCCCHHAFFSIRLFSVHVVHLYSSIDTTAAWKKLRFILLIKSDFHMTNRLSIAIYAFASRVFMSVLVDETLLPR